jgi:hypothetical protein
VGSGDPVLKNVQRILPLIMVALLSTPGLAMEVLIQDVLYQDLGDHIQLEVRLGFPAEVVSVDPIDPRTLRIGLVRNLTNVPQEWRSMELDFDEPDRLLKSVSLDGNDADGYRLEARFAEPVTSQVLPRFQGNRLLIKLSPRSSMNAQSRFEKIEADPRYAVELETRTRRAPDLEDIPRTFAASHIVYLLTFEQNAVASERLRLGFFQDRQAADRIARSLRRYFPDAAAVPVSSAESEFGNAFRINPPEQITAMTTATPSSVAPADPEVRLNVALNTPSSIGTIQADDGTEQARAWEARERVPPRPQTELDLLLDEAQAAFEEEDWSRAIALYDKLFNTGQEPYRQQALEMLGVSRELNDQPAHAKRYYEMYLHDYAGSEAASRVDQRLAAMLAFDRPQQTASRTPSVRRTGSRLTAQLSQFYQRHRFEIDDRSTVPIDGLFNDFNLLFRRNGESLDQEVRVTMSYLLDFSDNERLDGREYQVSSAYWEGRLQGLRTDLRVGRQSQWDSGALGRFDGASITYRPTDTLGLGVTGGYLIDASFDSPGGDRPFFGLNGEYVSRSGSLALRPFYVQQYADGVLDRRAIGMQAQLYTERSSFFSLVDYDLHHSALNNFTLTGNLSLGRSRLFASYEHRKNPYLTTRNALMGQRLEDLSELEEAILDLSLEELAADRTASSDTLRVGWNFRMSDHWTLNTDLVASDFSTTESSADVQGLEAHKALYSSVQLRSSEIFGRGSYSAVMLRVADSQTSATTSLYWDNRFNFFTSWYLYPRIRVDHRTFDRNDDEQWSVRPSLRLDYRMSSAIRFELESGYEWTSREMADRNLDINGLFIRAGYRASF